MKTKILQMGADNFGAGGVSGMPTADDVDGLTMNQSADGNWTATGTINGQTVTYNITPSQVSSN